MDGDWLFGFMTKLSGEFGDGGQGPDGAAAHLGPVRTQRDVAAVAAAVERRPPRLLLLLQLL